MTGSLNERRSASAAVLLPSGKVLIVGGTQTTTPGSGISLDVAELYDPAAGDFSVVGKTSLSRSTDYWSGLVLLNNGKVLLNAEIFDPATNTFNPTEDLVTRHRAHTATLLSDGKVLIAGGVRTPMVELYDPVTGFFSKHSALPEASHIVRRAWGWSKLREGFL